MKCVFTNKRVRFGNNVSNSNRRTKRTFKANIQTVSLFSKALNQKFRFTLSTRALKTVDKYGGLDSYVSKTKYPTKHTEYVLKLIQKRMKKSQPQETKNLEENKQ